MAIDTGIYGLSGRGVKSVNDYDREYEALLGAKQDRQMGALQLMLGRQKADEYTRGIERGNQLRALSGTWKADTTDEQRVASLRNAGFAQEADALEKGILERMKTRATVDKDSAEAASKRQGDKIRAYEFHVQRLGQVSDPQMAEAWLAEGVKGGVMSMQEAQQGLKILQSRPDMFPEWKARTLQGGMSVVEQLRAQNEAATAARQSDRDAVSAANELLVRNARGEFVPNEQLIAAKALIARSGASNTVVTMGSPTAATVRMPDGTEQTVFAQFGNRPGAPPQIATVTPQQIQQLTANGNVPLSPAKDDSSTEDARKATGWLVQAQNAYNNMQGVIRTNPSAARPGVADALADKEGVLGAAGNALLSADRQKFRQASSSLSEALLRAATGAGVNKDEALQKIRELTPVYGEKPETTQQKLDSIPLYLEALKARAGRKGSASAGSIVPPVQAAPAGIPSMDAIEAELRRRQGGK